MSRVKHSNIPSKEDRQKNEVSGKSLFKVPIGVFIAKYEQCSVASYV